MNEIEAETRFELQREKARLSIRVLQLHRKAAKADEAEQYVRQGINSFISDPPDDGFQEGYLEALVVVATEAFGIPWNDPKIQAAVKAIGFDPKVARAAMRQRFNVIDGGKNDEDSQQ